MKPDTAANSISGAMHHSIQHWRDYLEITKPKVVLHWQCLPGCRYKKVCLVFWE